MSNKVEKPWGFYEDLYRSEEFVLKRITVNPKSRLSRQSHAKRSEFWVVSKGNCLCELNRDVYRLREGEEIQIPVYDIHRLINDGTEPCEIIELQHGQCDENDIFRMDDDYDRTKSF